MLARSRSAILARSQQCHVDKITAVPCWQGHSSVMLARSQQCHVGKITAVSCWQCNSSFMLARSQQCHVGKITAMSCRQNHSNVSWQDHSSVMLASLYEWHGVALIHSLLRLWLQPTFLSPFSFSTLSASSELFLLEAQAAALRSQEKVYTYQHR